jgi:hypothetical protein
LAAKPCEADEIGEAGYRRYGTVGGDLTLAALQGDN